MPFSRLLAFCFLTAGTTCYAQSVYNRIITGFTAMSGGKTEWIDLDSDNDLDLLFAGSDGSATLTIVYENVAGTFTQRSANLPMMSAFATADYDNDGDMDLVAFNPSIPFTKLYRNEGNFVFSEVKSFGAFAPSSALWLDFDNDEDLDLLLTGALPIPRLFENTGAGFSQVVDATFPNCADCNADVADINGDGRVDIVFTGGVTALYLNAGNKVFNLDTRPKFKQLLGGDVACGDFDGDGDFDILLTGLLNNTPYSAIYENKNNHLVERTDLGLPPVVSNSSSGLLWFNVNNDGKIDLLITGSTDWTNVFAHAAYAFKNNGSTFTNIQDAYLSFDRYMGSYDDGDFDNDGDTDLAFQGTYTALEGVFSPKPVTKRMAGFYRHEQINKAAVPNTKPSPPDVGTFSETAYRKEIRLKWGDGSDGETPEGGLFYNFYLRDANKKLVVPSVNFSNGNVRTDNAPNGTGRSGYAFDMPEGPLYYAVQSIDGAKTGSVFSAEKMFYHFNGPEATEAKFTDQEHVNLSWLDHSSLEANFEVLRSTAPSTGFISLATLSPDAESYTDNFAFASETKYYYRIRAYNANASLYDSLVLVIPNRPTGIAAQAVSASRINLTWSDESQYETAYVVERKKGSASFEVIATLQPNVVEYEDVQLDDGATYEYRVIAQGANGALAPIVTASATTNAKPHGLPFEIVQDEDRTLMLSSNDFNNNFSDSDASDHLVKIKIMSLPENGTLYVYTSPAVVGQEVTPDLLDFMEFKPSPDYAGTATFNVLPYDGRDYGDSYWAISLRIKQINDPPVFDLLSAKALDEDFSGKIVIPVSPRYFPGEESQVITYSLSPQTSDILDVQFDTTNGKISLASSKDKFGQVEFTVTANDGQSGNNTYSRKIKVTIKAVDDPPVFKPIANISAQSSRVTIDLDVTDVDSDINASMFSAYSSNSSIVKSDNIRFSMTDEGTIAMSILLEGKAGDTYISVTISGGNFYVTRQFKLTAPLITGLVEEPITDIAVFPNPVSTDLQIERGEGEGNEVLNFVLRDVHGRKLRTGIIETSTVKIDLREFAPGFYFLEITGRDRTIASTKIVKR